MTELPAAILDIDGTLVDSNYQHAPTWRLAFARHGVELETWRIHRSIGMVFDVEAAARADVPTIALRTGGFGADELTELGAKGVYASLTELREEYGKSPLSG